MRLATLLGLSQQQEGVLGRYHCCLLALQVGEVTITRRQGLSTRCPSDARWIPYQSALVTKLTLGGSINIFKYLVHWSNVKHLVHWSKPSVSLGNAENRTRDYWMRIKTCHLCAKVPPPTKVAWGCLKAKSYRLNTHESTSSVCSVAAQ